MIETLLQASAYSVVFLAGALVGAVAMVLVIAFLLFVDDKFLRRQ